MMQTEPREYERSSNIHMIGIMIDTLFLRLSLHFTSLHLSTLHFFPFKLHPSTLHCIFWHFTSSHLNFTHLHFTTLHCICRHFTSSHLNFTQLHFTTVFIGQQSMDIPQDANLQKDLLMLHEQGKWERYTKFLLLNSKQKITITPV
jgi:hypothetical protein